MSRKKRTFQAPIAGGVAGAAFGGMLAAVLGDSMELLPGAAIGGVLIHESLHLFQETSYLEELGVNINEGMTEYPKGHNNTLLD